jgi:hypothetical protein
MVPVLPLMVDEDIVDAPEDGNGRDPRRKALSVTARGSTMLTR